MIRTLIFGALAGYVGKKLYDDGKLTQFKDDLVARYGEAKAELADKSEDALRATKPAMTSPSVTSATNFN